MELESNNLLLLIALGTMVTFFLSGSIIFFVVFYQKKMLQKKMEMQQNDANYQKQLLLSTIDSQEKERKRIASELHDGVGAMLSATKLNLGMLASGAIPNEEKDEVVNESKDMIDETIDTVRRISKDLLPSSLEQFGLTKAIEELCEKLTTKTTSIEYKREGSLSDLLDKQKQLLIYRIVQELINNALKHAEASKINILFNTSNSFVIEVKDNGKGFDLDLAKSDTKKGVGLYNIENRVSLLNGEIEFDSRPGKGATIAIKFEL